MLLTADQASSLDHQGLRDLVGRAFAEGPTLDYKRALSSGSPEEQRDEMLKDIAAFANAFGGVLLIGIDEPVDGLDVDRQIVGLTGDPAQIRSKVESWIMDCIEPRLTGVRIHVVRLDEQRFVLVVWVPASLSRPHLVKQRNKRREFFVRHNEQSLPMTVGEIRESVLTITNTTREVRAFMAEKRALALQHGRPTLIVQAAAVSAGPQFWPCLDRKFREVFGGRHSPGGGSAGNLSAGPAPAVKIDGVVASDSHTEWRWRLAATYSGYMEIRYRLPRPDANGPHLLSQSVADRTIVPFLARLRDLQAFGEIAAPFILNLALAKASLVEYRLPPEYLDDAFRADGDDLVWPEIYLAPGDDPVGLTDALRLQLVTAFGLDFVA